MITQLGRWYREWRTFLAILAAGALAGLLAFLLSAPDPPARTACGHVPGITLACPSGKPAPGQPGHH